MTYNTLNPVPSTDPRDLDDNSKALDRFLNSTQNNEPDRLGVPRLTWHFVEAAATALANPNVIGLAALTSAAGKGFRFTNNAGQMATYDISALGLTLAAVADAAAGRSALGLGASVPGSANGLATLGADGKLPVSQLPPLAINETFTVVSQAAMLALTAQRGDVAIRSDLAGAAYLLTADAPATLANWVPIQQNLGTALTALSAVTPAADQLPYFSGGTTAALAVFTAAARTLLAAASAALQRAALGVLAQSDKPAWSTYTPTITAGSGTFTTITATGKYVVLFGICHVQITVDVTTKGTGTLPIVTLPVAALTGSANHQLLARQFGSTGKLGSGRITAGLNAVQIGDYLNQDMSESATQILISGSYPVA